MRRGRYLHLHGTYIVAVQRLTGEKDMDILNDLNEHHPRWDSFPLFDGRYLQRVGTKPIPGGLLCKST